MPWMTRAIEYLPAGASDEPGNYLEAEVEITFDFQPAEAAVMDVNSPFAGPGCSAAADLIEQDLRRADGEPMCDALLAAVKAWWESHGEEDAIEQEETGYVPRSRRRIPADPCD